MRLDNLISALSAMPQDEEVYFDFCRRFPVGLHSYRGYYDQLALSHASHYDDLGDPKPLTVAALVKILRAAIGQTFQGWKGGDFVMGRDTQVWVDNAGEATGTGISGVIRGSLAVIITTRPDDE